jgi:hypothetical protein
VALEDDKGASNIIFLENNKKALVIVRVLFCIFLILYLINYILSLHSLPF